MNLTFTDPGNGPAIIWAGIFTIVAIVGSVLLSVLLQKRDFNKRENELKKTFAEQDGAQWAVWRRQMAERAAGVITKTTQAALEFHDHGRAYVETHQEVDEVSTLLHLDISPGGEALGHWITKKCRELNGMRPIGSQDEANALSDAAGKARAKVMMWARDPETAVNDEEMQAESHRSGSGHTHS